MERAQGQGVKPTVAILGAGPAGLGAAYRLATRAAAQAVVLEQRDTVGGNAGSFLLDGVWADYGSHRLHPSCDPGILADLVRLLGSDLLRRPRHGRIRLQRRWIHFPLRPADLLTHLPLPFAVGAGMDVLCKPFRTRPAQPETFASVLARGLGPTICRDFYFPYAKKIWGLEPDQLSPIQALRRVSASSAARMLGKARSGKRYFYYPRFGFGALSERLYEAARDAGAEFRFESRITRIESSGNRIGSVHYHQAGSESRLDAESVWSTAPINWLVQSLDPPAPAEVLEAACGMRFRAMILIYLVLEQSQFSEYDAHYFPEAGIPITRLSEPKNYSESVEPREATVLCAELPCEAGSYSWRMDDNGLGDLVRQSLDRAGIPIKVPIRRIVIRRLERAYPLYDLGYEARFSLLDSWLDRFENLLTFGRQGLFAHDNTHHALFMAYSAVDCLDSSGAFNRDRWREFRRQFETHVVED
jgi:protoporphyrinogen oxidase